MVLKERLPVNLWDDDTLEITFDKMVDGTTKTIYLSITKRDHRLEKAVAMFRAARLWRRLWLAWKDRIE